MLRDTTRTGLAMLAVAVVAVFSWHAVLGLSLYAWDTFPLIAASRVASASDFAHIFTRELMDGRFPGGHFYRPLVELSFACDHALWGLDARGYHLTDLAILVVAGALCVRLATRVLGAGRAHWAVLAGLIYVLHPVQFEILPLPPRRADALSALFVLLAIGFDARRWRWLTALACLCAIASKETGVIAAPLVFAFALAASSEPSFGARAKVAWRASWPSFALLAPFLVARTIVLGGIGGGAKVSFAGGASDLPAVIERYATLVLCPLPPGWLVSGGIVLAFAGVLVVALWTAVARSPKSGDASAAFEPRAVAFAVLAWCAMLAVVTAVSGVYRAWYALPFVAPLALLVALAAAYGSAAGGVASRAILSAIGVLALLQGWASDGSPRWNELRASSDAARRMLADFDAIVTTAQPGSTHELVAFPSDAATTRHGVEGNKTMLFAPYSLKAWVELRHPDPLVRIEAKRPGVEPRPPIVNEVLVLLVPRDVEATKEPIDDQ
jgi:hypothetical protein